MEYYSYHKDGSKSKSASQSGAAQAQPPLKSRMRQLETNTAKKHIHQALMRVQAYLHGYLW
jgi:hypothetical protein